MISVTCPNCGKDFNSQTRKGNHQIYCSRQCRAAQNPMFQSRIDLSGQRFGRLVVSHRTTQGERKDFWVCVCDCGNEIARSTGELNFKKGMMQSCGCYKAERLNELRQTERMREIARQNGHKNKGRVYPKRAAMIETICTHCGKPLLLPRKKLNGKATQNFYCNVLCWYRHIRENPSANGRFLGGRFPYYGPNWDEQARLARERDNHTCQHCGKHQIKPLLDVHHIVARRHFDSYKEANRLENLITLCKSCHAKMPK